MSKKKTNNSQSIEQNIGFDSTQSYENGAWDNIKLSFQQQIPRYFSLIESQGGSRTIKDINGLLSFIENTMNNILNIYIKQNITISKLSPIHSPRIKRNDYILLDPQKT